MPTTVSLKTKSDSTFHYATGVVYTPLAVDTDMESMTEHDVRKMAHDFIASGLVNKIDTQHDNVLNGCEVVESFIARKDDPDFPEGSWVLTIRMKEDSPIWEKICKGELNGYSVEMFVTKVPKRVMVDLVKIATGATEANSAEDVPDHSHEFYCDFDSNGKITFGVTDEVLGHKHSILTTVTTEASLGHAHRYFVED